MAMKTRLGTLKAATRGFMKSITSSAVRLMPSFAKDEPSGLARPSILSPGSGAELMIRTNDGNAYNLAVLGVGSREGDAFGDTRMLEQHSVELEW